MVDGADVGDVAGVVQVVNGASGLWSCSEVVVVIVGGVD